VSTENEKNTRSYLLAVSSSPHAHSGESTSRIMWTVFCCLVPAAAVGVYAFGLAALSVILFTTLGAMAFEAGIQKLSGQEVRISDGSAALTGLLLALNLPAGSPWWMCLTGSLVAVILAKAVFGGLGQNPFNPALTARVFLLLAFAGPMTKWLVPRTTDAASTGLLWGRKVSFLDAGGKMIADGLANPGSVDAVTAATPLGLLKEGGTEAVSQMPLLDAFLGHAIGGSLGEVSAAALLLGAIFLLIRGYITWHIPVSFMATVAIFAAITNAVDPARYAGPVFNLVTGGVVIGACFMATDYVTSPMFAKGKIIFGIGCGMITMLIRLWAGYPEGVSFSILLMNALTPIIDRYTAPMPFGFRKPEPAEEKS